MGIELNKCDCFEFLSKQSDGAFDLCITSPPYNLNLRVNGKGDGYCSRQIVKEISTKYNEYSDNLPMDEYESFLDKIIKELVRTCELTFLNIQMVTGNKPALFSVLGKNTQFIKELIVWDKGSAQPAIGVGVLNSSFELIIVLGGKPITRAFQQPEFERGKLSNIWRIQPKKSSNKDHGASFPVELPEKILSNFAKTGSIIFDPFLGTGTTAIACSKSGYDFVGCEINHNYLEAAKERIYQETSQNELDL